MLVSPLRRFLEDPEKILTPFVREGMAVLEIGPGMGYYSLPLARMVGNSGRVVCVDVQERMLRSLQKRAAKAGLIDRITPVLSSGESLRLEAYEAMIDFAYLFAVVHEVPDKAKLFEGVYRAMKYGGRLLFSEPNGHVTQKEFDKSVAIATSKGLAITTDVDVWRYRSVLMSKTI